MRILSLALALTLAGPAVFYAAPRPRTAAHSRAPKQRKFKPQKLKPQKSGKQAKQRRSHGV